jgi:hypothetical protein
MPEAPAGSFCVLSVADEIGECVDIDQTLSGKPSNVSELPIGMMDNYISMSPETWSSVQTYLRSLRSRFLSK